MAPKPPLRPSALKAALLKATPRLRADLDECTRQIREVQARLGTDDMQPGDIELARELGHRYMNLVLPFMLDDSEQKGRGELDRVAS